MMFRFYLMLSGLISLSILFPGAAMSQSVLATGEWYKIHVNQTGIHRITYDDLVQLGMDPASLDPADIRLYGNGGGMLPEANAEPRISDLRENSVVVVDGGDGRFDPGDYIIFYGEGPDVWLFDPVAKTFSHQKNLYADHTCYFITASLGAGNRVELQPSADSSNYSTLRFTDHQFHDVDKRNLIRSGKIWVGETFSTDTTIRSFRFYFPDAITTSMARINTFAVARSSQISTMYIRRNGELVDQFNIDTTDPQSTSVFARPKLHGTITTLTTDSTVITLEYGMPNDAAVAWLNYVEVIAQRFLRWTGPQFSFRDPYNIGADKVSRYVIGAAVEEMEVWNVSDPGAIKRMEGTWNAGSSSFEFALPTPVLHEFVAFDHTFFHPVSLGGRVENQDLHSLNPADLIIIVHPLFREQADRLADFHRNQSGLSVIVEEPVRIYNEFASGQPDPTAIRDFVRMLWLKASGSSRPKYLLLVGDGSYDYKDRIPGNTNFVPTFESEESFKFIATFVTDDYFGIMAEYGGLNAAGPLDIGMGRFPVATVNEAKAMVDKIIQYAQKTDTTQGPWRNQITFVADDEDTNLHLIQAEELAAIVGSKYPVFNVNKIYLDAYQLVTTPSGGRYPAVNEAINKAVNTGSLIVNYTGHGGEDAWSGEKVLTFPDIESWTNQGKYPVFITATCEFSRFDNPERFSAGEAVIVKPNAGAVALYTTTRLALATANFRLDTSFFRNLMNRDENGEYLKMGDLLRISKNNNNNNNNIRNFVLLGDPAQPIAFPEYRAVTTRINGKPVDATPDTLLGLSVVEVEGEIRDHYGNKATGFSGTLEAAVFDKPVTYRTLANQPKSYKEYFLMQNSLLSDGPAEVKEGGFAFSFMVPLDISPGFGYGKISYYACSETTDANGYNNTVVIGGKDPSVIPGNQGPDVSIFLDNRDFVPGGKVGYHPLLLVDLADEDGINHVGLGIGHELLAVLDDNWSQAVVLNPYYASAMNGYQQGTVVYPFRDLAPGRHTLTIRAWDMVDNVTEKTIDFYVFEEPSIHISDVYVFPNPVTDGTTFTFRSASGNGNMEAEISISSVTGEIVKTIAVSVPDYTGYPMQAYWDGTADGGKRLRSGVYPYMVRFRSQSGAFVQTSGKVIIL